MTRADRGRAGHRSGRRGASAAALVLLLTLTACSGGDGNGTGAEDDQTSAPSAGSVPDPGPGSGGGTGDDEGSAGPANPGGPEDQQPTSEPPEQNGAGDEDPGGSGDPSDPGDGEPGDGERVASAQEIAAAREEVAQLDLRLLAGQLIVASYGGTDSTEAAALVARYHLGGVITLGDNVPEAPAERLPALGDMSRRVHDAVRADGRPWPAFIAIDQEGGPVTRVGAPLDQWPAAMALGAAGDPELAAEVAMASGEQLRALGYTVVLAPVADVTIGAADPTIGARSFGSDPEAVAGLAQAQVDGYLEAGVLPVVKHFPGHGSVTEDTHVAQVSQPAPLEDLEERDLLPFARLAEAEAPAMMTAHIILEAVDPEQPATLSAPVLTELLREDLGYRGLVVTDAMNMAAISQEYGPGAAAVAALRAGADVLLMPADPGAAIDAIVAAVEEGTLERSDLEDSAALMVAQLRALEQERPDPGTIGSDAELAADAALAAVTQLTGPCEEAVVTGGIRIQGGSERDRALLAQAAQNAGVPVGNGPTVALLGAPVYRAGAGGGGDTGAGVQGDIVVALDVPYRLAESSAGTAMFAVYGRDQAAFDALIAVLTGAESAPGALPVEVSADLPVGSGC